MKFYIAFLQGDEGENNLSKRGTFASLTLKDCQINEFWGLKVHKSQLLLSYLNITTCRLECVKLSC